MFILTAFGGEYDDSWTSNIAVSENNLCLQKRAEDLHAEVLLQNAYCDAVKEAYKKLNIEHPCPTLDGSLVKEIPKWKDGLGEKDITLEMRQEREDIKAYNTELYKEVRARVETWQREHWLPILLDIDSQYNVKEEYINDIPTYFNKIEIPHYNIEEIEVI